MATTKIILGNPPRKFQSGGDFSLNSLNSFLKSSNLGAAGGDFLAGFGNKLGQKFWGDSFSEDEQASQSTVRNALAMIPGYGQLISLATGAVDAIGSATGLNLSSINQDSADRLGLSGAAKFNHYMNMLPGNSAIIGSLGYLFGGGRSDKFDADDDVLAMGDGFSATVRDLQATEDIANKHYFTNFSKDKANDAVRSGLNTQNTMKSLLAVNTQRKQSDYAQNLDYNNYNRFAGQNYLNVTVGKEGIKLPTLDEARDTLKRIKSKKLQEGGSIPGIDSNIIPDGKLHKERHHLEDTKPEFEDITKKGIPVIAKDSSSEATQTAEVEREEIIFRLEVTQRLEELRKEGTEEAMIEAGKLIAEELITNTVDNAGIINGDTSNQN